MKLKVLGTMSPIANKNHNCPGFLITDGKYKLMLDCGSGSHKLLNYPNDLENFHVIITHLHEDHYNDIGNLQYGSYCFHNQNRTQEPIQVSLPKTPEYKYKKVISEKEAFAEYNIINEKDQIKFGNLNISFLKTDHAVETYAIKVENTNKTIVYTSDTSFSGKDKLVQFAKGADLLICESSLLKEHGFPEINSHLTAYQAGIIAKESKVKGLMLTHFWFEEDLEKYVKEAKQVFLRTIAAKEGQIIDFDVVKKDIVGVDVHIDPIY